MSSTLRWAPILLVLAACSGSDNPDLTQLVDADGDGFFVNNPDPALADCDDRAGVGIAAYPGGNEICDGLDNNCDGTVDEDAAEGGLPYFPDEDGDGYGKRWPDGSEPTACKVPKGFSANRQDCNDNDGLVFPQAPERCNQIDDDCDGTADEGFDPTAIWFLDRDGDGFGGATQVGEGCATNPAWTRDNTDCNDVMRSVNPDADEVCDNFDNDCDGLVDIADDDVLNTRTWYQDADGDGDGNILARRQACGYTDLTALGYVLNDVDCNDASAEQNRNTVWFVDSDRDGFGIPGATWPTPQCNRPIGHALNTLDCDDSNPNEWRGRLWYADADGDGYGAGIPVWQGCGADPAYVANNEDCDDRAAERNPGAIEICDGGIDNDCNGLADDDDPDATGQTVWFIDNDNDGWGVVYRRAEACDQPEGFAAQLGDCDDFNPLFTPETLWYRDVDRDGYGNPDDVWPVSTCEVVPGHVPNGDDCDDADFNVNGLIRWWPDADGDGLGVGVTPSQLGCITDTTGLATWTGDCNDNDPNNNAGGCFGPQQGTIDLTITTDLDPSGQIVSFECLIPGQPPTIQNLLSRVLFTSSDRDRVLQVPVVNPVTAGRQCRAKRTWNSNDIWGDGVSKVEVYACDQLVATIAGRGELPAPTALDYSNVFVMPACSGCTDPAAENYDPDVLVDTSPDACIYPL